MAIVYAVVNQKGGVGKTTTAVNVAACLADAGRRVLLVDLDPQSNATSGLGVPHSMTADSTGAAPPTIYGVLIDEAPAAEAVTSTSVDGLAILPSNIDLAGAEIELMPRLARETCLKRAIQPILPDYDFVLIDTPPSLGILTINALVAADRAIVPIQCEYYALEGVSQLMRTVDLVQRHLNPGLTIDTIVLTMYDNRVRLAQQVVAEVRKVFGDRVARTIVPRNVRLSEAPSHGLPIVRYDPRSRGATAYREITQEVLARAEESAG